MTAPLGRFPLTSDECELLALFEATQSLAEVAEAMGRDHSVIARSFKRIAERHPVVEKKAGKWILTEMGRAVNEGTRAAIHAQVAVLNSAASLKIGTNREFAARILCADFQSVQALFPKTELTVNAYQQGTEAALLQRQIDIGIDCERPNDPDIAYKLVIDEEIIVVASPAFAKKHKLKTGNGGYIDLPHLLCERLNPDKMLMSLESRTSIVARFNDVASARAACMQGAGWAFLPAYAVREELKSGQLVQLESKTYGKAKYGVWWLRGRPYLKEASERLCAWLAKQNL